MTLDLDNLRALVAGWDGQFLTDDDGALAFDPASNPDRLTPPVIDEVDDGPENIASMLNALPALLADHARLGAEVARLNERQQELLQTIRNLSASVPYAEEERTAAVLIAEVGTLRSEVAQAERERAETVAMYAASQAEVARLRAFKLHAAGCYNSWANGGASGGAAIDGMEAIGDELGEPFAEGDRG